MCCIHWECLSWMRLMMSSWGELLGFLAPNTATNANHTAAGCSLSLGSLSRSLTPQTPSSHPFQPLYPFLEALLHSEVSPGEFVCMCVCVCVCVFGLCVYTWARRGTREKKRFLLNVPFEQLWVEHRGVNPSFSFSLWIELTCKALKIVEGPIICRIRSAFPSFISGICCAIFCKGFFPPFFWYQTDMVWDICLKALQQHLKHETQDRKAVERRAFTIVHRSPDQLSSRTQPLSQH